MSKKNQSPSQLPFALMVATVALGSGAAYFVAATPEKIRAPAAVSPPAKATPAIRPVVNPPLPSVSAAVAASQPIFAPLPVSSGVPTASPVALPRSAPVPASAPPLLAKPSANLALGAQGPVVPNPIAKQPLPQQAQKSLPRPMPAIGNPAPPVPTAMPLPAISVPSPVAKESTAPPRPIFAEPLVRKAAAPIVLTANQDKAWVRVDETTTVVIVKGQSVEGLGTYHGLDGGAAKFDKGSFNVSP